MKRQTDWLKALRDVEGAKRCSLKKCVLLGAI
jgi:hypothetical protein